MRSGSADTPKEVCSVPRSQPTSAPERRWLSQAEAAEYLGVTDRTIRAYVARGTITGRRLAGSRLIRIDRHELDSALRPIPTGAANAGTP
jgi:excisionase family DNA binding protein